MRLLLDVDMIAHECGHLKDDGDVLQDIEKCWTLAKGRLNSIVHGARCGSWRGYLTTGTHWRHDIATVRPYKGTRKDLPRDHVDTIKKRFDHFYNNIDYAVDNEADDAISIAQWGCWFQDTVIASRDKDLDTVPGWHYKWHLGEGRHTPSIYWISGAQGLRNFYKQLLQGDASDNIHGLYNVGPKSVWLSQLDKMYTESSMHDHVWDKYIKYYGDYAHMFMEEAGKLLHMSEYVGDRFQLYPDRIHDRKLQEQTGES